MIVKVGDSCAGAAAVDFTFVVADTGAATDGFDTNSGIFAAGAAIVLASFGVAAGV